MPGLPDFLRAFLLKGEKPDGTLTTVKTDDQGYLIIVAKGHYLGQLRTLATDDQGRVLMVPWDPGGIWGTAAAVTMAEVPARLWSPKRFDRCGEVLFMTSFEDGLAGVVLIYGTGTQPAALTTERARTGGYSLKFTLGPASGAWAAVRHVSPYFAPTKFGWEISFTHHASIQEYGFSIIIYQPDHLREGVMYYYPQTKEVKVAARGIGLVTVGTNVSISDDNTIFHTAKLVVDATTMKYVRGILDNNVFNLSAYEMTYSTGTFQPAVRTAFSAIPVANTTPVIYIDDLIVTQNES